MVGEVVAAWSFFQYAQKERRAQQSFFGVWL
jgi:hypothetical protein